jgi:4,5-DOPA dioxygenase extradiol
MLTGNPEPETIHDFGGFPQELYALRYPVKGAPELAASAVDLLKKAGIAAGVDGCRGLDHGAWVPLRWMYPEADVPIVQLSLQPALGAAHHLHLGRALAPLVDEGVLMIGSGHTTHNLRDWMTNPRRAEPLRYVQEFAGWLRERLAANDVEALLDWREQAPAAARAHPSEEHFLPLFVAYGAAGESVRAEPIVDGFENGALAMDSYRFRSVAASRSKAA